MMGGAIRRLAPDVAPGVALLAPSRADLDLTDRAAVAGWYAANPVDAVIHAALAGQGVALGRLELLQPLLATVPLQLFACELASQRGHDVDQPRNLAKSVTVE